MTIIHLHALPMDYVLAMNDPDMYGFGRVGYESVTACQQSWIHPSTIEWLVHPCSNSVVPRDSFLGLGD